MNTFDAFSDPEARARRSIALELGRYYHALAEPPVRLANVVRWLHGIERLGEREKRTYDATEAASGESQLGGYVLPWSALTHTRALGSTQGAKGGYMVEPEVGALQDALRNDSAIIAAGAQAFDNLDGQLVLPRVATRGAASWVGEGVAPSSDAEPVLGAISMAPRTVVATLRVSVQLLRSAAAESFLRGLLLAEVGSALDKAAAQGAGGVQPLGIVNANGITAASGTSLSYSSICAQIEALHTSGARPEDLFALAGPTAARILSTRERAAGSGYILDDGRIANVPCFVTPNVPASTLILGARQQLAVASWGPGIRLEASGSSGFNTAQVDLRALVFADVAVLQPAAFVVFATVT